MNEDFHVGRRVVVDLADFDFPLLVGLEDRVDERRRGLAEGYGERFVVQFFDFRPHLHRSAAQAVVVARHVDGTAGQEVGIKLERFVVEITDGGLAQLAEVVRQYLGGKTHGDALRALRQEEGEFHGQRNRLLVTAIVGELPLGGLGVEEHVEREFGKAGFDVTRRGGTIAGEDVAPVPLTVDKKVFLSELHQRIADGGIAVGVELHGMSHDVGHLVVTSVVEPLHGVQDAPLHGFETVAQVGHGTLENHVGGIVKEPVLVHPGELEVAFGIAGFLRLVVGVAGLRIGYFLFVAHGE